MNIKLKGSAIVVAHALGQPVSGPQNTLMSCLMLKTRKSLSLASRNSFIWNIQSQVPKFNLNDKAVWGMSQLIDESIKNIILD